MQLVASSQSPASARAGTRQRPSGMHVPSRSRFRKSSSRARRSSSLNTPRSERIPPARALCVRRAGRVVACCCCHCHVDLAQVRARHAMRASPMAACGMATYHKGCGSTYAEEPGKITRHRRSLCIAARLRVAAAHSHSGLVRPRKRRWHRQSASAPVQAGTLRRGVTSSWRRRSGPDAPRFGSRTLAAWTSTCATGARAQRQHPRRTWGLEKRDRARGSPLAQRKCVTKAVGCDRNGAPGGDRQHLPPLAPTRGWGGVLKRMAGGPLHTGCTTSTAGNASTISPAATWADLPSAPELTPRPGKEGRKEQGKKGREGHKDRHKINTE